MRLARPRRSKRNLAAAAFLLALAFAAFWLFRPRDEVTPVLAAPPGALVYATTGFEEIDALGGTRHEYPPRTTITVVRAPGGCLAYEWRPLEGRAWGWDVCDGELRAFGELHRFFGRDDRRLWACDEGSSFERGWRCVSDGTVETAEVVASRGGHVRLRTVLTGETTGSGSRELWLRADGAPLRMVVANRSTTSSLLGAVTYRERYELRLVEGGSSRG